MSKKKKENTRAILERIVGDEDREFNPELDDFKIKDFHALYRTFNIDTSRDGKHMLDLDGVIIGHLMSSVRSMRYMHRYMCHFELLLP